MTPHLTAFEQYLKDRPTGISPLTIQTYILSVEKFTAWLEEESGEPIQLHALHRLMSETTRNTCNSRRSTNRRRSISI